MNMKKYFYIIDDEGKPTLLPEFDQKPNMAANLTEYISKLLQVEPVLLYLHIDASVGADILRNLDQKQENGQYTLVIFTDRKWIRGIDYRSKAVKMVLLIARSFDNYREAI